MYRRARKTVQKIENCLQKVDFFAFLCYNALVLIKEICEEYPWN